MVCRDHQRETLWFYLFIYTLLKNALKTHIGLMEMIPLQRVEFKDTLKIKALKLMRQARPAGAGLPVEPL